MVVSRCHTYLLILRKIGHKYSIKAAGTGERIVMGLTWLGLMLQASCVPAFFFLPTLQRINVHQGGWSLNSNPPEQSRQWGEGGTPRSLIPIFISDYNLSFFFFFSFFHDWLHSLALSWKTQKRNPLTVAWKGRADEMTSWEIKSRCSNTVDRHSMHQTIHASNTIQRVTKKEERS